jgi:hypothetical protein
MSVCLDTHDTSDDNDRNATEEKNDMTALTATARQESWSGQKRHVTATLPTVNHADTYDTGLTVVDHADVSMRGAAGVADTQTISSISGGVLTFAVPTLAFSPAAITSAAPNAITAANAAGADPDAAEHNALVADVTALRTTLAAVQADVVALRAILAATPGTARAATVYAVGR